VDFRLPVQSCGGDKVATLQRPVSLRLKGPVVYPNTKANPLQRPVLVLGPKCPPFRQQLVAVPFTGFDRTQTRTRCLSKGQENMGMMIMRMVAFLRHRRMNGDIRD
jgi:hypothetical protein